MLLRVSSDPTRILPPFLGCFRCTRPLLLESVRAGTLSYSAVQLFLKYSNLCENHRDGQTACNLITALCVASRGNKRYISAYALYFFRNYAPGLHFAADNVSLSSLKFLWWAPEFLFRRAGRFGRSRSSKVTDIGANRKRVCDFLLVRNSDFGPILHRFGPTARFMCS